MREQLAEQPTRQDVDWDQLEAQFVESEPLSEADRFLTEVDHLNANRLPDGSHSKWVLDEQFKNIVSATKEAAMPYAVTRTEHDYEETGEYDERGRPVGTFMWLGKTAVENAMSGRRYHWHPAALERVEIEVDEARDSANLEPGVTSIFISPRMTEVDAPLEVAKNEHLAKDDAVRTSEVMVDQHGSVQSRAMESLLFRDIPLKAWVGLLNDPDNELFGRSIGVKDNGSATAVMEVHQELKVDSEKLPNGVISVVEAVVPYIEDPEARASAEAQLERFYESQEDMHDKAVNVAKRWQDFEVDLADSLHDERATPAISSFIEGMLPRWSDEDLSVILEHELYNGEYTMSRELAAILEKAKQNLLWTRAAVITENEHVLNQLDAETAERLHREEMFVQQVAASGSYSDVRDLDAQLDRLIASRNVGVGGGCPGESETNFKEDGSSGDSAGARYGGAESGSLFDKNKVGNVTIGKCEVQSCPTRPNEVIVGGCGVCLGRCQRLFDQGKDPSKAKPPEEDHEFELAA